MTALEIDGGLPPGPPGAQLLESCTPVLETERLMLRAPRLEDAVAVAALLNDRHTAEMTATIPHPYAEQDAINWINAATDHKRQRFVMIRKADGALLGATGFLTRQDGLPDLGFWLGLPYRGEGFTTEAARAVVDYLFAECGAEAITASCRVINPDSRKVLERCGFQWESAGLSRVAALNASVPVDRFRLDVGLWRSLKAWRGTTYTRRLPEPV